MWQNCHQPKPILKILTHSSPRKVSFGLFLSFYHKHITSKILTLTMATRTCTQINMFIYVYLDTWSNYVESHLQNKTWVIYHLLESNGVWSIPLSLRYIKMLVEMDKCYQSIMGLMWLLVDFDIKSIHVNGASEQ